jgi:hypothetical protein
VEDAGGASGGQESELATLIRCLNGAQANDSSWPVFKGKYVEYPRFKKEWWAYRRTYHRLVWDEPVNRALKEKSLVGNARAMVNDIEDLQEIWDTLDTCYDWPEKYIAEALEPVIKFRKYGVFENGTIREFYSLLRSTMLGTRRAGLLHRGSWRWTFRCGPSRRIGLSAVAPPIGLDFPMWPLPGDRTFRCGPSRGIESYGVALFTGSTATSRDRSNIL